MYFGKLINPKIEKARDSTLSGVFVTLKILYSDVYSKYWVEGQI